MPSLDPRQVAAKLGGKLYASPSRLEIAWLVDQIFIRVLKLFDLTSISRVDRWLLRYAREKLFQKAQTLFQMGKREEFMELLEFASQALPRLRELASRPDVFVTVTGEYLDPEEVRKRFNKPMPPWVKHFIESHPMWKRMQDER